MIVRPVSTPLNVDGRVLELGLTRSVDASTNLTGHVATACRDGAQLVLVDISGVSTVTPSGIADVVHAVRTTRTFGGDLRLYGHSPAVTEALHALDLARVLTVHADRRSAVRQDPVAPTPEVSRRPGRRQGRFGRRSPIVGSS